MRPLSPEEERQLVWRLRRRDERAFALLVRELQTPVFNLVFRMVGDREEALDVSQEVFVTVFRAIDGFRGDSKLSTWVYRIAMNHCRNRLKYLSRRRQGKHEPLEEGREQRFAGGEAFASDLPRPDAEAEGRRAEDALKEAIGSLEPEQREVLLLRDVQGLSYQEIGDVTGQPPGTVKSRLHRARCAVMKAYRTFVGDDS